MAGWTFAGVWEAIARAVPQRTGFIHGDRRVGWEAFERRASALAEAFLATGVDRQAKIGLYLYNAPEYMEAVFGTLKAGLVPVNVNYRYRADELVYLFDNADAEIVVYHATFDDVVDEVRRRCPAVRAWIRVTESFAAVPDWAQDYETAARGQGSRVDAADHADGDDLVLIYTGGTTGMPKGVMWRQDDLYMASNTTDDPAEPDLAAITARIEAASAFPVGLSAAPLMHGTGFVFATTILSRGGTLVTQPERTFDANLLLDSIAGNRVTDLCIVGDAFARPIVDALDAEPDRWDVSSLRAVSSSGMVWSREAKERLLVHAPGALLIDFLNSSEASGMGRQITSRRKPAAASDRSDRFRLGRNAFVIDEAGRPLEPGSGTIGRLAVRGRIPLGYHKDPAKTEGTFPLIDGVRCSIPGDLASLTEDGSIVLLGRGSTSINTGGEKVFPEEVEAVIKTCPGVRDALVVGLPEPRFGEIVAAIVEAPGENMPDADRIIAHVRERLAKHKAPRHVMVVADVGRTVTGKADYPAVRKRLTRWLSERAE